MTSANSLGEFLQARRAAMEPDHAVDARTVSRRRVPGLRREEVATRAGVSVDYYTRIEQGRAGEISEAVLTALADALRLDRDQRSYLDALTRPAPPPGGNEPGVSVLARFVNCTAAPAALLNSAFDVLASNEPFRALTTTPDGGPPTNMARFIYVDPRTPELIADWELAAHATLSRLRHRIVRQPGDEQLAALVNTLARDSDWFAEHWSEPQMDGLYGGPGAVRHPAGTYRFDLVTMAASPGAALLTQVWLPTDDDAQAVLDRIVGQSATFTVADRDG